MLLAGELPTIKQHFVDRGLYCTRAVANIPSITLANQTSIVTGQFPGHHGVLANNWFDRNRLVWRNYATIAQKNMLDADHTAPTIFEHLPDRTTVSMLLQAHRGATKFVENRLSGVGPYAAGWHGFIDRLTLLRFNVWADIVRGRQELPAVTFVYLILPDFEGYGHGVSTPQYRAGIRHTDRQMGRVLADLDRAGVLEDMHLVLLSDHGLVDVTQHFSVREFLDDHIGIDVAKAHLWEETAFERRMRVYQRHTAVVYGAGERHRAVCLRRPGANGTFEPWPARPTAEHLRAYPTAGGPVDLPAALVGQDAIEAVAYAVSPDDVRLVLSAGEVAFRQPGGRGAPISYERIGGDDPLGYEAAAASLTDGRAHAPEAWLAGTIETDYPGLPDRLVAYFRAPRAGDLALFAAPDWDFNRSLHAGHGGLRAAEMLTPLVLAGPGVQPGRLDLAQTVDVMPTLLGLLGRPVPTDVDGRNLLSTGR